MLNKLRAFIAKDLIKEAKASAANDVRNGCVIFCKDRPKQISKAHVRHSKEYKEGAKHEARWIAKRLSEMDIEVLPVEGE